MTSLGKIYRGSPLDIVAVDCLANHYNQLLDEIGIRGALRPIQCESERLLELFPPNTFDLVFSRNALDHGYDPMLSIYNMVEIVNNGCPVVLKHGLSEAEESGYRGLHQWNFSLEQSRLILWNLGTRWNVEAELNGRATVKSFMENEWLVSICIKL
jgi:hypothetical protein